MTGGGTIDTVGDNKEFALNAIEDVTIYFVPDVAGRTSSDDTATAKYFNTSGIVKQFALRTDQTLHIKSMSGVTLTDPITVVINKIHTEKFDVPVLNKIVIRPLTVGTNVKIRTRGR